VLVVDDEPMVAHTLRMVLTISGHEVIIANDAESALATYEAGRYDLVFTDFSLPAMDGLELARLIRARCPAQPIVLITAFVETIAKSGARVSNVDMVLGKPFSIQEVQEAMAKLMTDGSA
jgi:CheY-like chemotaxis protein